MKGLTKFSHSDVSGVIPSAARLKGGGEGRSVPASDCFSSPFPMAGRGRRWDEAESGDLAPFLLNLNYLLDPSGL